MIRILLLFSLLILTASHGYTMDHTSQSDTSKSFCHWAQLSLYYGKVLPTNEFLRGEYESGRPVKNFRAISLSFGWQTKSKQLWQYLYGNPSWGFGLYHAGFDRPDDMGSPIAIYGFYTGPFKRWNRFSILYDIHIGVSFNWIPFDIDSNEYQISLGNDKAAYVKLGFRFQYEISRSFNLDAGLAFTHFSNGSTVKPNKGINMVAPHLGIRYQLKGVRPPKVKIDVPKYKNAWEWMNAITYGRKQVAFDTTYAEKEIDRRYVWDNYSIVGLISGAYYQFSYKSKAGLGLDFLYDESFTAGYDEESTSIVQKSSTFHDRFALGAYGSYELVINKLSFLYSQGFYIIRKERSNETPTSYQRVGFRFYIFPNLAVGLNVKAWNFSVADYLEWNVGYRLRWQSK